MLVLMEMVKRVVQDVPIALQVSEICMVNSLNTDRQMICALKSSKNQISCYRLTLEETLSLMSNILTVI